MSEWAGYFKRVIESVWRMLEQHILSEQLLNQLNCCFKTKIMTWLSKFIKLRRQFSSLNICVMYCISKWRVTLYNNNLNFIIIYILLLMIFHCEILVVLLFYYYFLYIIFYQKTNKYMHMFYFNFRFNKKIIIIEQLYVCFICIYFNYD